MGETLGFFEADAVFPVGVDEPDDSSEEYDLDGEMKAVEDFLEARVGLPFVAELHADVGEDVAPGPGADESVGVKAKLRHLCYACGKSYEGTDYGKEASDEDGDSTEALEEVFDTVEVVTAEEDVFAETLDSGAASPGSEPVGGDGSEVAADGSGGGDPEEFELASVHEIAGEGHDDLGRQGDAGGLDAHEERDADVASGGDDGDDEAGKGCDDLLGHAGLSIAAGRSRA